MFFWPTTGEPVTSRSGAIMHPGPRMLTFSNWQKLMGQNSPRSTLASQALFSFRHLLQKADDRLRNSCCRTFQTIRNMLAIHSPEHLKTERRRMTQTDRGRSNRTTWAVVVLVVAVILSVSLASRGQRFDPDSEAAYAGRKPTGYPQLVSVEPLPETATEGEMCA